MMFYKQNYGNSWIRYAFSTPLQQRHMFGSMHPTMSRILSQFTEHDESLVESVSCLL